MKLGLALAQYGPFASLDSVTAVARGAEELGYDSLWVGDRLISPLQPKDPYPGGDGTIPPQQYTFLDPIAVLAVAAAVTDRVRLGTCTLNPAWSAPPLIARSFATLDRLSGGRAVAGFGLGWSRDEYAALGVPWEDRGDRLDDVLAALRAIWSADPVAYASERWTIPPSVIEPKPANLPVYLAAFTPPALRRVALHADGWLTVAGLPLPAITQLLSHLRQTAEQAGRDPQALHVVMRCNPTVTDEPLSEPGPEHGTVTQIAGALAAAVEADVHEVLIDLHLTADTDDRLLELADAFRTALK